jgi:hypothetical protein
MYDIKSDIGMFKCTFGIVDIVKLGGLVWCRFFVLYLSEGLQWRRDGDVNSDGSEDLMFV